MEHYKEIRAKIKKDPPWRTKQCVVLRISCVESESLSTLDLPCKFSKLNFRASIFYIHSYRVSGPETILAHHRFFMTLVRRLYAA